MFVLEIIVAVVGVAAGLASIVWDVMQIQKARTERQRKAAVTIQRAFRQYRAWKLSYGDAQLEFKTETVPHLPAPEREPSREQSQSQDHRRERSWWTFNLF